jgi:DDE family transposase
MYLRTIQRRNLNGSVVRYLQLAHNEWDPATKQARAKVVHSFGREDALDRDAIHRLIKSLTRALDPAQALTLTENAELAFVDSRPLGGAWTLDHLWRRLGIRACLERLLADRRLHPRTERVLFALVANRALKPLSKLAATTWMTDQVAIDGLESVDDETCYRAMDWLLQVEAELSEAVYFAVADLLNLEVDLLFFDTTSIYFEIDEPDAPELDADGRVIEPSFRTYGHSKDHRPDLPQVVVGMAVTRQGIPIRVWVWPGNTADATLIEQVRADLRAWKLNRVVWVADTGFNSAANRRYLQRAGGHYILGEKLRGDSPEAQAALERPGRYHTVAGNLAVKEVVVEHGSQRDRFVICRNPDAATRDAAIRDELIAQLQDAIKDSDRLTADKRRELLGRLSVKPGFKRFLRTTPGGLLRIDRAAVESEARLDGKFLLRTSDPSLSAEDVALGYKQLLEVERGWRDLKMALVLRPVFHRKEERIRAHVLLCWLALLLIRVAEVTTTDTWRHLRDELDRMHLGTFRGSAGVTRRRTELTTRQRQILAALQVPEPPQFIQLEPALDQPA